MSWAAAFNTPAAAPAVSLLQADPMSMAPAPTVPQPVSTIPPSISTSTSHDPSPMNSPFMSQSSSPKPDIQSVLKAAYSASSAPAAPSATSDLSII